MFTAAISYDDGSFHFAYIKRNIYERKRYFDYS